MKKKIIQMLPTLAYGDAVGNDTLALRKALEDSGYETEIYTENIDPRLPNGIAKYYTEYVDDPDSTVIYHLAISSVVTGVFKKAKAKKIVIYHNVTPGYFFDKYSPFLSTICNLGIEEVKGLATVPQLCIADSEFNMNDLIHYGYKQPIEVLPILIQFDDYNKTPDQSVIDRYKNDGYTNIIFTGRIAPNKKQEDLVRSFYYYKTFINPKSRLFIVGSNNKTAYENSVAQYVKDLDLEDSVIFTGHIPFAQILSYYKIADVFLCLSEHEGFCVPVVEAMYFSVPVIAYDSTAVGETLGGAGILLKDKDPRIVAEAIDLVVKDEKLRKEMQECEAVRLKDFDNTVIKQKFFAILKKYGF